MRDDKIKVVHVTTIDRGGAYRAVTRLSSALCMAGADSEILLRNKTINSDPGISYLDNPIRTVLSKGKNAINGLVNRDGIDGDLLGRDISKHPVIDSADIIVIHWVNSFLTPYNIRKLIDKGKPVIIMLHDMWHMTGGCHYSDSCDGYTEGCVRCPRLSVSDTRAKRNLLKKAECYKGSNVTVVAPSRWMRDEAKKSSVFRDHRVECIHNCVDTNIYRPLDKKEARTDISINTDKAVILFSALNGKKTDKYKGFDELIAILNQLRKDEVFLLVAGHTEEDYLKELGIEYRYLGHIDDENTMAKVYNAADVTIVPSRQESFGFSACESLCCGTPVVAFDIGGLKDQIVHKVNGYLATPFNYSDFVTGIRYCIENNLMPEEGTENVRNSFGMEIIGNQWIKVIREIV